MLNILGNIARVPAHWFRITYAHNAFLRSLGGPIDSLTVAHGVRAMRVFARDFRPQHGELDVVECSWGPGGDGFEFAVSRRMQRHGHPETTLSLVFSYVLTPARQIAGSSQDITDSAGYRAISRATIIERRLQQLP
jgi:hypothetical protein